MKMSPSYFQKRPLALPIIWLLFCSVCLTALALPPTAPPRGHVSSLSVTGVNYLVTFTSSDDTPQVKSYPRGLSNQIAASGLLDTGKVIVLDEDDPSNKRILILSTNTVEVYHEDITNYQCVFVESLVLPTQCEPRYLLKSSLLGDFFVSYHGNCHSTCFSYYEQMFGMVSQQGDFDGPNIVVAAKNENDIFVHLNEGKDRLNVVSIDREFNNRVFASSIGECAVIDNLYPFSPYKRDTVYFAVNCTTASGDSRQYHVAYNYKFGSDLVVTGIAPGIPVGDDEGRFFGVRGNDIVTVYDVGNLENGVPGAKTLSGPIEQLQFFTVHNSTWLSVFIENNNAMLIEVEPFVTSRGIQGTHKLPNTNIGVCDPTCLPQTVVQGHLVVSVFNEVQQTYSYVLVSFNESGPQETLRVEGIPATGRPLHSVFIEDPNLTPPPPTIATPTPESPETPVPSTDPITEPTPPLTDVLDILTKVLPSVFALLIIVSVLTVCVCVVMYVRNKKEKAKRKKVSPVQPDDGGESKVDLVGGTQFPLLPKNPELVIHDQGQEQTETQFGSGAHPTDLPLTQPGGDDSSSTNSGDFVVTNDPTTPLLDVVDERSVGQTVHPVEETQIAVEEQGASVQETACSQQHSESV